MKNPPRVRPIYLPSQTDGGKVGLDDFFAAGRYLQELLGYATDTLRAGPAPEQKFPYQETPQGLVYLKPTRDGAVEVPLCNFTARIVSDLCRDDGLEMQRVLEVEAKQGNRIDRVTVAAHRFASLNWAAEALGARAILAPGATVKDHTRVAIQLFSQDTVQERRVYTHTGWRCIDERWVYLHASGAIGQNGMEPGIEVTLPDTLSQYLLSVPPQGQELVQAVQASLQLLQIMPRRIAYPSYATVWRAVLGEADASGFLSGKTGQGKSEWAALLQQHFGAGMDRLHIPASFSSTGNSLEIIAFHAKDTVLVVDDFCPTGSTADIQRYHKEADRIFRAQGNRSGRGRLRSDGTLRPTKYPRGLIMGTGEDVPKGQSLRARLWILEITEGDMNWSALTQCQADAAAGLYAQAMAAYLQWLSPRYEEITAGLKKEIQQLRNRALQGAHRRTPEIVANLAVGFQYFLQFALDVGAVSQDKMNELWQVAWAALGEAAQAQARFIGDSDPARRFIELVVSAIASGEAHIADLEGGEPAYPRLWGWREYKVGTGNYTRNEWRALGKRVGWVDGTDLYLNPEASFAAAQTLANRQGDGVPVTPQTLRARLKESGYLASWDIKRQRNMIRRVIEGRELQVLHLPTKVLMRDSLSPPQEPSKPTSEPESPQSDENLTQKLSSEDQNRPDGSIRRPDETSAESETSTATGRNGRSATEEEEVGHQEKVETNLGGQTGRFSENQNCPGDDNNRPELNTDVLGLNEEAGTASQEASDVLFEEYKP